MKTCLDGGACLYPSMQGSEAEGLRVWGQSRLYREFKGSQVYISKYMNLRQTVNIKDCNSITGFLWDINWGSSSAFPESVGTWRVDRQLCCCSFRLLASAESGLLYGKHLPVDWKAGHVSWVKCLGLKFNTVEPGLRTSSIRGRLLMSAQVWAMSLQCSSFISIN